MPTTEYPSAQRSYFPDAVTRLIDDERRRHLDRNAGISKAGTRASSTYRPPGSRSGLTRYIYSDNESRSTKVCRYCP